MAEMLLQGRDDYFTSSRPHAEGYVIDWLPALPKEQPKGLVKGLLARGVCIVDIE